MPSIKQIEANRQNAQKSTGPRSANGKLRTRTNAWRHGLTAETVIAGLENADEYAAFEAAILVDYRPGTTVEHALATRLASLLWRLRRSVAIETGLFEAQGRQIDACRRRRSQLIGETPSSPLAPSIHEDGQPIEPSVPPSNTEHRPDLAQTAGWQQSVSRIFFELTNNHKTTLDQIEKYEVGLWRQVAQISMMLDSR